MVLDQDIRRPKIHVDPTIVFPEKMTTGDIEIMLDIAEGDIAGLLKTKSLKRALPDRNWYLTAGASTAWQTGTFPTGVWRDA